jgi:hypothetical protein
MDIIVFEQIYKVGLLYTYLSIWQWNAVLSFLYKNNVQY